MSVLTCPGHDLSSPSVSLHCVQSAQWLKFLFSMNRCIDLCWPLNECKQAWSCLHRIIRFGVVNEVPQVKGRLAVSTCLSQRNFHSGHNLSLQCLSNRMLCPWSPERQLMMSPWTPEDGQQKHNNSVMATTVTYKQHNLLCGSSLKTRLTHINSSLCWNFSLSKHSLDPGRGY